MNGLVEGEKEVKQNKLPAVESPKDGDGVNPMTPVESSSSSDEEFLKVTEPSSDTIPPSPKDKTSEQVMETMETGGKELEHPREQKPAIDENLREKNLQRKRISPDGNCLFAAFADQLNLLTGQNVTARALRTFVSSNARDMMTNKDSPIRAFFIQETLEGTLSQFENDGVWNFDGNDLAPRILGELLLYNVRIFHSDGRVTEFGEVDKRRFPLWINVTLESDHYNSTVPLVRSELGERKEVEEKLSDVESPKDGDKPKEKGKWQESSKNNFDRMSQGSRSSSSRSNNRRRSSFSESDLDDLNDSGDHSHDAYLRRGPKGDLGVLVLFTGGTFGMGDNSEGKLGLKGVTANDVVNQLKRHPDLGGLGWKVVDDPMECNDSDVYFHSFLKPIDSSDATVDDWHRIRDAIEKFHRVVWGFVVIHGTDTLAWSSSALSFMLPDPSFPVVFTGSQISIFKPNSDGWSNFIGALECVRKRVTWCKRCKTSEHLAGVFVYFNSSLMVGPRVRKSNSSKLDAFKAKNSLPVAQVQDGKLIFDQGPGESSASRFLVHLIWPRKQDFVELSPDVVVVKLYPGMKLDFFVRVISKAPGVVLEAFGAGNCPGFVCQVVRENPHIFFACVTQCFEGAAADQYAVTGNIGDEPNFVHCHDMTVEAAATKLSMLIHERRVPLGEIGENQPASFEIALQSLVASLFRRWKAKMVKAHAGEIGRNRGKHH